MLTWNEIKALSIAKNISLQYKEEPTRYLITLVDGTYVVTCELLRNGEAEVEFETQFKTGANRRIATAVSALADPDNFRFRGDATAWTICVPGPTNIEFTVNEERFIDGGSVIVKDANPGDYCVFCIVHPLAGVVEQFVNKWFVTPGTGRTEVEAYRAKIPAGLKIRVVYHNTGLTNVECGVNLRLHRLGI